MLAVDHRDTAATALFAQLRLRQAIDREYPNTLSWFMELFSRDLALVVGRLHPTDAPFAAWEAVLSTNAALLRTARIAIAIERAKVSNASPEIPKLIDPYSGERIRVKRDDQSYAVYSVGQNRRDDGGHPTLDVTFRPVPAPLIPNP